VETSGLSPALGGEGKFAEDGLASGREGSLNRRVGLVLYRISTISLYHYDSLYTMQAVASRINASIVRRHLDSRLEPLRNLNLFEQPNRGWIRAIRDGLGMTAAQLARRMGVKQSTVSEYEKGERARTVTLETLDRAAEALGCRLVYALVPEKSLEATVRERARLVACHQVQRVARTMTLEAQRLETDAEARQVASLAEKLIAETPASLWDTREPV